MLSDNPNITWEIIKENLDKPWRWDYLSQNANITWEIVKENPDKPWVWEGLSLNQNITWEIVKENLDEPWNWYYLSNKKMIKAKEEFIRNKFRYHFMQEGLFEELISVVWHPKNMWKFKYLDPETYGDLEF